MIMNTRGVLMSNTGAGETLYVDVLQQNGMLYGVLYHRGHPTRSVLMHTERERETTEPQ
jgi:hypothetical protein